MWASVESGANLSVQNFIVYIIQSIHSLANPIQSSIVKTEREELKIKDKRLKTRVNKRGSKWELFHDAIFKAAAVVFPENPGRKQHLMLLFRVLIASHDKAHHGGGSLNGCTRLSG